MTPTTCPTVTVKERDRKRYKRSAPMIKKLSFIHIVSWGDDPILGNYNHYKVSFPPLSPATPRKEDRQQRSSCTSTTTTTTTTTTNPDAFPHSPTIKINPFVREG